MHRWCVAFVQAWLCVVVNVYQFTRCWAIVDIVKISTKGKTAVMRGIQKSDLCWQSWLYSTRMGSGKKIVSERDCDRVFEGLICDNKIAHYLA